MTLGTSACLFAVGLVAGAQAQQELPDEPFARLPLELREALAALDPAVDGWQSEVLAEATGAQLERLARWLEARAPDETVLAGLFAPEFRFQPGLELGLVPGPATFTLRRPGSKPGAALACAGFLASLRALVAGDQESRAEFQTIQLEQEPELVTQVLLTVVSDGPAGVRQSEAWWQCRWRARPEGPPELLELTTLALEQTQASQRLFSDRSALVLGALPTVRAQLQPGLSTWRARLDTRLGQPLLGPTAGLALGDVDGDGLEDLYLCQPGGLPNRLLLHRPDGTLVDRSADAGLDLLDDSRAALLVDFDGDGDRDLAVTAGERLLFFANDGRARFWLATAFEAPEASGLAAADIDLDGDLDLYVCAYASPFDHAAPPQPFLAAANGQPSQLYENQGEWIFSEVARARGLDAGARFSRAAAFEDYDRDGDADLYVTRDFGRDSLYRNEGGHFVDVAQELGLARSAAGTGVAWGDADGDGRFDLFVSRASSAAGRRVAAQARFQAGSEAQVRREFQDQALGSALFRNGGDGRFEPLSTADSFALARPRWTSGALFVDLDNDGWQDLVAPGGLRTGERSADLGSFFARRVVAQAPLTADARAEYAIGWAALHKLLRCGYSWAGRERAGVFWNLGGGRFADVSAASGLALADDPCATALSDWDGDGDLDLWSTGRSGPGLRFLRNEQRSGNAYVTLELEGTRSNRAAIGARAELDLELAGGARRALVRAVRAGEGCLAQSSTRLTFGIPAGARLARVSVVWPGGGREDFRAVEPGRAWRLVEASGRAAPLVLPRAPAGEPSVNDEPAAPASPRVVLARPVPLPRLDLVADDGNTLRLFGLGPSGESNGTGKPLLLTLFHPGSTTSVDELTALARHADELERSGIAVLALSCAPAAEAASSASFLAGLGWPFPWATAPPDTRALLDALRALLLDQEPSRSWPASFLVDARGSLRVLHGAAPTAEALVAERALLELGEDELLDAAVPFPGRWMFPSLPGDADFFEPRLRARGLEEAAREYARGRMAVLQSSPVQLLQEFARRAALEGRFEQAESLFRRALGLDPRHFGVLFDWAVVAHRQEKLALARELYGKCLVLRPEDVDAHFNLALAELGLGQREAAERELRWLEQHAPQVARTLAEALANTPGGK